MLSGISNKINLIYEPSITMLLELRVTFMLGIRTRDPEVTSHTALFFILLVDMEVLIQMFEPLLLIIAFFMGLWFLSSTEYFIDSSRILKNKNTIYYLTTPII